MAPVRDLRGVSFYTDAAKSVADPALKQAADEAVRPLWDFVKAIDALVDAGSAPAQDCALRALAAWARGGALLGQANQQGGYEREMALSGLSLAFARLGDARARAPTLDASVGDWLRRVALAVEPAYTRPWRTDNRNNHAYWAGLAVAATGDTTGDPALVAWGLARLSSVSPRSPRRHAAARDGARRPRPALRPVRPHAAGHDGRDRAATRS